MVPLMTNVAQLVVENMKELDREIDKKHFTEKSTIIYAGDDSNGEKKVAVMAHG